MPKAEGTLKTQFIIIHSSFQGIGPSGCMHDSTGSSWEPGLLPQECWYAPPSSSTVAGTWRGWPLSTRDQAPKGTTLVCCSAAWQQAGLPDTSLTFCRESLCALPVVSPGWSATMGVSVCVCVGDEGSFLSGIPHFTGPLGSKGEARGHRAPLRDPSKGL